MAIVVMLVVRGARTEVTDMPLVVITITLVGQARGCISPQ